MLGGAPNPTFVKIFFAAHFAADSVTEITPKEGLITQTTKIAVLLAY